MMRVGIIGAGISGLGAALALKDTHEIVVFEAEARLGGHANTLTIDYDGAAIDVDTGFIVYNAHNYPNLIAMFADLGVETIESDMSFAVSDAAGTEWSSNGLAGLFAWKRNLANPAFLGMLGDIVRFSTAARADIHDERLEGATLEEYVDRLKLSRGFLANYLLPMGAAIWSTPEADMLRYPAQSFLRFFDNHRLLHAKRPIWRTVNGGSRRYVEAIARQLGARMRRGEPALSVGRLADQTVRVRTPAGEERFDQVILACHSDQALAILEDATPFERQHLSAVRYAPNTAYLHRDPALMPRRRAAWASWNYMRNLKAATLSENAGDVCVSYWMNALQKLDPARNLFVTLNPPAPPQDALTFAKITYAHPQFDQPALSAQRALRGRGASERVQFAGAWLGYGFHEDGLTSGLEAARALGGAPPWARPAPALEATMPAAAS